MNLAGNPPGRWVASSRLVATGRWVTVTPLAIFLACAGADDGGNGVTVTDSAGIEIVSNDAPAWHDGAGWSVDPVPVVEIGGRPTADDDLYRVSDVKRLSDGSVVVASTSPVSFRRFSPDGTLAAELGRDGEGPGEFRSIALLRSPGDTIVVWDQRNGRLTRLHPDGTLIDARQVSQGQYNRRAPFAVLPDGSLLAAGFDYPVEWHQLGRREIPLGLDLVRPDGSRAAIDIDWIEDEELIVALQPRVTQQQLFFPPGRHDFGFARGRLFASLTLAPEIEVREPTGELRRLIRWNAAIRLVDEAAVDLRAIPQGVFVRGIGFDPENAADIDLHEIDMIRDELPVHGGIEVDSEGNVWVHELDLTVRESGSLTRFQVFDGDSGRWLGLVELPAELSTIEIGADYVAGLWRDDLFVEYVRVYALARTDQ